MSKPPAVPQTVLLHLGAAIYREGRMYGFELRQGREILTRTPPVFETAQEAKEASSKILSFAAEKIQQDLKVERMLRVQRDLPEEL